MRIVDNRLR